MKLGYTMLCEQTGPKQLISDVARAEALGFDFAAISDHYFPWLAEQGHSPYAWSVLGAAAQATEQIGLMTFVTCPTMRYHPAVVAQKAATVSVLSDGRFTLGLGAGENLNEHVTGRGWPSADVRHAMLSEAADVIQQLFDGGYVSYRGQHITVDSAKLWDVPPQRVPVAIAASGAQSAQLAAGHGDALIAVTPDPDICRHFEEAGGSGKPAYGQVAVCYGQDKQEAASYAAAMWSWSAAGWKAMAELPGPESFAAYGRFVRPEDITETVPCGPDPQPYLDAIRGYEKAGFSHVALVQVGAERQDDFFGFAESELIPAFRER